MPRDRTHRGECAAGGHHHPCGPTRSDPHAGCARRWGLVPGLRIWECPSLGTRSRIAWVLLVRLPTRSMAKPRVQCSSDCSSGTTLRKIGRTGLNEARPEEQRWGDGCIRGALLRRHASSALHRRRTPCSQSAAPWQALRCRRPAAESAQWHAKSCRWISTLRNTNAETLGHFCPQISWQPSAALKLARHTASQLRHMYYLSKTRSPTKIGLVMNRRLVCDKPCAKLVARW